MFIKDIEEVSRQLDCLEFLKTNKEFFRTDNSDFDFCPDRIYYPPNPEPTKQEETKIKRDQQRIRKIIDKFIKQRE